ncbi:MAG: hypothetical protein L0922_04795, partial [Candidatus Mariimomonas ferrooxydans]
MLTPTLRNPFSTLLRFPIPPHYLNHHSHPGPPHYLNHHSPQGLHTTSTITYTRDSTLPQPS